MKKATLLVLFVLMTSSLSYAATTQATVKESVKSMSQKMGNFFSREGERSGLKQSTSSWGNFWTNANPVNFFKAQQDNYNARKAGGVR